jgi:hypothetical protein
VTEPPPLSLLQDSPVFRGRSQPPGAR